MCWLCISAKYAYFGAYAYLPKVLLTYSSTTFTSSYSAITGQTPISLILVLCTTVVLSAVPGSCIFMWIPLLENKKIRPAGLQWWPYQNKKTILRFSSSTLPHLQGRVKNLRCKIWGWTLRWKNGTNKSKCSWIRLCRNFVEFGLLVLMTFFFVRSRFEYPAPLTSVVRCANQC